jgi:polyisoprenoid-binding protein YceI
MSPRSELVPLIALSFLAVVPTAVSPSSAAAASCVASQYVSYSSDYARTTNVSGGCTRVGVRHRYSPQAASNSYSTSWVYGANSAQTPSAAELSKAEFYAQ